jgi:Protein of unknown function (DUF3298)
MSPGLYLRCTMKKHTVLLLHILLLAGCNYSSSKQMALPQASPIAQLTYHTETIKRTSCTHCGTDTTRVDIAFSTILGLDTPVEHVLHANVYRAFDQIIAGDANDSILLTPHAHFARIADDFIADFNQYAQEEGYRNSSWYLAAESRPVYCSEQYLVIQNFVDIYTGGSHPNHFTSFDYFDIKTGSPLNIKDFLKDSIGFQKHLEKIFRIDNDNSMLPLSELGLFQDFQEGFPLPEQIHITSGGATALYNSYEISPYSMGTIIIEMDSSAVKNFFELQTKPIRLDRID